MLCRHDRTCRTTAARLIVAHVSHGVVVRRWWHSRRGCGRRAAIIARRGGSTRSHGRGGRNRCRSSSSRRCHRIRSACRCLSTSGLVAFRAGSVAIHLLAVVGILTTWWLAARHRGLTSWAWSVSLTIICNANEIREMKVTRMITIIGTERIRRR